MIKNKANQAGIKNSVGSNECVAQAPWLLTSVHNLKYYPYHFKSGSRPLNYYVRPNLKLGHLAALVAARRIVRKVVESPNFNLFKPYILGTLFRCLDVSASNPNSFALKPDFLEDFGGSSSL